MVIDVGEMQFMNNEDNFHARTTYTDLPAPAPGRHLLRLWLATPESEGGWKVAFHNSDAKKRSGVQVDRRPAKVLFYPERSKDMTHNQEISYMISIHCSECSHNEAIR